MEEMPTLLKRLLATTVHHFQKTNDLSATLIIDNRGQGVSADQWSEQTAQQACFSAPA